MWKELFGFRKATENGVEKSDDGTITLSEHPVGANSPFMTEQTAVSIPAVFASINVISTNIAKLNIQVYKKGKDGTRTLANTHPVAKVLNKRPNEYQSPFDFMRLLVVHLLSWGNSYVNIEYDGNGDVQQLWLFDPSSTDIYIDHTTGQIWYYTTDPITNQFYQLKNYELAHIRDYNTDGIKGKSRISVTREIFNTQKAMGEFSNTFFSNGTVTTTVLKTEAALDKDAKNNVRSHWESMNSGMRNAHRVAVLDAGLDVKSIGMPLSDAQFLEQQKYNTRQIASIYSVPPHMIGDLDRATWGNIEQQALDFVKNSLSPILKQIEQELAYKLFKPRELEKYELRFDVSELISGDSNSRAEYYTKMLRIGGIDIDTIREREYLNPIGENGSKSFVSMDLIDVDTMAQKHELELELLQKQVENANKPESEPIETPPEGGENNDEGNGETPVSTDEPGGSE